jgi:hypothetical protein
MMWPWEAMAKIDELEQRVLDLERHFVTKRDEDGKVTQTLADVPVVDRKNLHSPSAGMSWPQRRRWLEATDGGRRAPRG